MVSKFRHDVIPSATFCSVKLKFHWDQFPRNFPVANVTGKSPTSYEEVGRVASLLRGSYEQAGDFQTISTCQDGLACRYNFLVTIESLTWYEEVGDVANKSARKLRGNWSQWNLSLTGRDCNNREV